MKKYKNIFGTICGFAIGTIIASITATYAATTLSSKNVYYDNTTSGGSSTNVSGAIDELYATADDQDILMSKIIDKIYPIGSVYISTTDSSVEAVEEKFGGEWEAYSTGKTLIGAGTGTDVNDVSKTFTVSENNSKTGVYQVELKEENLPNHTHTTPESNLINGLAEESGKHGHYVTGPINHSYGVTMGDSTVQGQTVNFILSAARINAATYYGQLMASENGIHTHTVSGKIPQMTTNSCANCSNKAISVQDPYTVVYMYKRIN